jgi:hypothetical protein
MTDIYDFAAARLRAGMAQCGLSQRALAGTYRYVSWSRQGTITWAAVDG